MKTFYGEGRINGNLGIFVAKADEMDTARDNISRGVSMKELVRRPNTLYVAKAEKESLLEEAIEKGYGGMRGYRTYDIGHNTWFLEFFELPLHKAEEE